MIVPLVVRSITGRGCGSGISSGRKRSRYVTFALSRVTYMVRPRTSVSRRMTLRRTPRSD